MLRIDESGTSLRPMSILDCIEWIDKPYIIEYKESPFDSHIKDVVKCALSDIDRKIELCKSLPIGDREKACKYLISLCELFKTKICSFLGYDLNYRPSDNDVLEEIKNNLQQYLDAWVEAGFIDYSEEDNTYIDDVMILLNTFYISADNTEGLIDWYAEEFSESAAETLIKAYKNTHQYAAGIESDIDNKCQDIAKYISFVQQEIKFIEQTKLFKTENAQIVFSDYLLVSDKGLIMSRINSLISRKKGRNVAIIIKALEELKYISPISNYRALYNTLKTEFKDIGSYEGMLKYLQNRPNITPISSEEINQIKVLLSE